MGICFNIMNVYTTGTHVTAAWPETIQMWLCLVPILLQLLTKKAPEKSPSQHWSIGLTQITPAAIAGVIDGLSLPLHKPIIANLETAHLQSVFFFLFLFFFRVDSHNADVFKRLGSWKFPSLIWNSTNAITIVTSSHTWISNPRCVLWLV